MTIQLELPITSAGISADEGDHGKLSRILSTTLGWSSPNELATISSRVTGLGQHGITQALRLIDAHPEAVLQPAAMTLIAVDDTDGLAFLGVDSSSHPSLTKLVRLIGTEKRYQYRDLLQAPERILSEARTIVAVTNLCLSGAVTEGLSVIAQIHNGWALNDRGLVALVQKYHDRGDEIVRLMQGYDTCEADLLEEYLEAAPPVW